MVRLELEETAKRSFALLSLAVTHRSTPVRLTLAHGGCEIASRPSPLCSAHWKNVTQQGALVSNDTSELVGRIGGSVLTYRVYLNYRHVLNGHPAKAYMGRSNKQRAYEADKYRPASLRSPADALGVFGLSHPSGEHSSGVGGLGTNDRQEECGACQRV